MRTEKILIVDFGSQYTQLIARRVRELYVYSEVVSYRSNLSTYLDDQVIGVILAGSPASVRQSDAPTVDLQAIIGRFPILGICYGAQLIAHALGGEVEASQHREYGKAELRQQQPSALLDNLAPEFQVWMSHADTILALPRGYQTLAGTGSIPIAAFANEALKVYGLQFHPEVTHTTVGKEILGNFLYQVCRAAGEWRPGVFIEETVRSIAAKVGSARAVCGLSGGVDSTVAAALVQRAIGNRLLCLFIDTGLLRKNEAEQVLARYGQMDLQVTYVNAAAQFMQALAGVVDPEEKRKIIGRVFIEVFEQEARRLPDFDFLVQGTIYPDVIESSGVAGTAVVIKTHNNVGGLPERMHLKLIEPLRDLFKDEVRRVGAEMGAPTNILNRHPFPGPGLAIRILGLITPDRVKLLQEVDAVFIDALVADGLYDQTWQAFAVLLPVQTVGVMGDERTYEYVVALRAVSSVDGMTADWSRLPYDFLARVSTDIINKVRGVNRVVYDISTKPPATIEWE